MEWTSVSAPEYLCIKREEKEILRASLCSQAAGLLRTRTLIMLFIFNPSKKACYEPSYSLDLILTPLLDLILHHGPCPKPPATVCCSSTAAHFTIGVLFTQFATQPYGETGTYTHCVFVSISLFPHLWLSKVGFVESFKVTWVIWVHLVKWCVNWFIHVCAAGSWTNIRHII